MPTLNFTVSRARIAPCMAEIESTYGTDPTPVPGTDDLLTYDSSIVASPQASRFEFRPHAASFTRQSDIIGMRWVDVNIKTLMQTSGTNGTIEVNGYEALDALLSASACTSTATPATNIVTKPAAISALESATVWVNHHGYVHKVNGCYFNCVLTGNPNGGVEATFRGMGLYSAPVAVASIFNSWTGGTKRAQPFLNVAATIHNGASFSPVLRSFTHDFGVEIIRLENANDSTGLEGLIVVDRNPTLELVIAADTYTSANITYAGWFTDWLSSGPTMHNIDFSHGATTLKIAYNYPTAQLVQPSIRENTKIRDFVLTYKLQHTSAETEWDITFGA